ncbi:hypothetical protein TYRP_017043 [Tyrophagus putrescentiae]|nr:hypothetical protein TYRP_017043 [Tyrophagus putrescentiae]
MYSATPTLYTTDRRTSSTYPSFIILSIGQMATTIVLLQFGKTLKLIDVPQMSFKRIRKLQPLPLLYAGNLVTTLGSTKVLSLPMFSVLRRLAILFILIAEFFVLKIKPSLTVQCTVVLMIAGAFIAACNDLAFDLTGYAYVLVNNLFAASYTVYIGAYELLYNNALLMFLPVVGVSLLVDSWRSCFADFSGWSSVDFVATFAFACLAGFLMVWSTVLCTAYNSALTTAILGTLRSILVTYLGMYISSDYAFSVVNFIGLNVSMVGSLVYCYVVFIGQKRRKTVKSEIKQLPNENS